jgi:Fibronectin type III domain
MTRFYQKKAAWLGIVAGGSLLLFQGPALATDSVTFGWAPNPEPDIAGYRIHYGAASRLYTQVIDTGNATTATIGGLVDGTTYYFALSAYNTVGLESGLTGELVYEAPVTLAPLQIHMTAPRQALITVNGPAGHTYDIQASTDLANWATIASVTIGANGSAVFSDNNPPSRTKRFYRATAAQP